MLSFCKRQNLAVLILLITAYLFGCASNKQTTYTTSEITEPQGARRLLDTLMTLYANKELETFKKYIAPNMIGYETLVEDIATSNHELTQIRTQLTDVTIANSQQISVISAKWQKRFLRTGNLQQGLSEGSASFMFEQIGKHWRLIGMSGDDVFKP